MPVWQRWRQSLAARAAAWAKRRQGEDALPTTVHGRRVYILPTRAGVGFALLLLAMLLAGLNYTNSMALFITFLLAGFCVVGMHLTHRNLLGVKVLALTTVDGFVGESGRVLLTLGNDADTARALLTAQMGRYTTAATHLPPKEARRFELELPLARRGVYPLERIRLATRFPFGLFEAWTWLHVPAAVLAYPAPRGERPPPVASREGRHSHALHRAGDDEWSHLRAFRDGDSPRQIAWRAYARGGDLLVKEYESPAGEHRLFDLEAVGVLPLERALEQLSAWCVGAHARGEKFGLDLGHERFAPQAGLEHRDRCLAALARYGGVVVRAGDAA